MAEHPNAARMRAAAAAAQVGDLATFLGAFSPSCTWRVPGDSTLSGVLNGHEGIERFFGRLFERTGGNPEIETEAVLGSDDHAVVFLRLRPNTPDGPIDTRIAHFASVGPDGRFDKNWFLPSDLSMFDRCFG